MSRIPDHAAEIADVFGLGGGGSIGAVPASGLQGRVWELRTARGRYAVKELLIAQQEAEADADVGVQERMLDGGISLPRPIRTVDGRVLADVAGKALRAYEWVDLEELDRRVDPGEIGRVVAQIHAVELPAAGPVDPWYVEPVGADNWDALVSELRAARAPFEGRLAALRDELVATETLMGEPSRLQTCHRDLFADNLRRTADGSLCVIDWENCGAADPSHELAVVLLEFAGGDDARARALYTAYVDAGGRGRVSRRSDFTMAIAQLGHILAHSARHWIDATDAASRERYEASVSEFVDEPLTCDLIDRVLVAIA